MSEEVTIFLILKIAICVAVLVGFFVIVVNIVRIRKMFQEYHSRDFPDSKIFESDFEKP